MAEESKTQTTATARAASDEGVSERQAVETSGPRAGKLKAGYSYRFVPERDEAGRHVSRKVYAKAGG